MFQCLIIEARRTPRRRKVKRTYACSIPWYVNTYFHVQRTNEYRVYTLIQNNFNRGRADAYGKKKQSVRMASLIGSNLAKINRKLDRVEKNRCTSALSSQNQLLLGCYDVSLANSKAPEVCLFFRMYQILAEKWPGIPDFGKTFFFVNFFKTWICYSYCSWYHVFCVRLSRCSYFLVLLVRVVVLSYTVRRHFTYWTLESVIIVYLVYFLVFLCLPVCDHRISISLLIG